MGDSVVDYAPSAAPTANGLPHQADDDSAYSHPLAKLVHRAVEGDIAGAQADILALSPSILSQVGEICHASRLLRSARLYSLAEAMLQSAAATGESHWIARELAYVAHEAGDRELSHERFRAFLEKYPQSTIAHYDFIQSLTMNLDDNRLSEEFAASALSAFPDDLWVGQAYAICAENRADWDSALTRWARVCASHPAHEPAIDGITRCSLKRMSVRTARIREPSAQLELERR